MKIMVIAPSVPWPLFSGGHIRVFETLRHLSCKHDVTLVAAARDQAEVDQSEALSGTCKRIETSILSRGAEATIRRLCGGMIQGMPVIQSYYYDRKLAEKVCTLTSQEAYDIIQIEHAYMAQYLSAVSPISRAQKVLSMHNVESIRFEREIRYGSWNARRVGILWDQCFARPWEERAIGKFDGIVAVSDLERAWIHAHVANARIEVVPNGVDTKYFYPCPVKRVSPTIVFTGVMDYPPNIDAAMWFCNEILPILQREVPNICFKIVGSKPTGKILELGKRQGVHVTGEVADIRPYVAESLAVVVPLRSGGGTRLKILQAMAMGCPVISTGLGAEGLEVTAGETILIANDAEQFVNYVLLLMKSPEVADRLGKAGRQLVTEKYDWEICLRRLENLYERLLESES